MILPPRLKTLGPLILLTLCGPVHALDGEAAAGKQIYDEQMCNLCHRLAGESGPMAHVGGSLDGLAQRRDADWIRRYLKNPQSVIPESQMPPSPLTDPQIDDLIAFLLSK
ncbi:c-type cytochrome [Thiorhodococcus minor]|uniref:Cytochrome c n=1 Tax=Thiorhodococcus minor TaxID=57489 RepID=A0A6M0K4X1_9GAMM|nr:c-type cytochrome [Thiorhodococcus minor]NEV63963.1 cytochrome c [Thiorhodococcus minor]